MQTEPPPSAIVALDPAIPLPFELNVVSHREPGARAKDLATAEFVQRAANRITRAHLEVHEARLINEQNQRIDIYARAIVIQFDALRRVVATVDDRLRENAAEVRTLQQGWLALENALRELEDRTWRGRWRRLRVRLDNWLSREDVS